MSRQTLWKFLQLFITWIGLGSLSLIPGVAGVMGQESSMGFLATWWLASGVAVMMTAQEELTVDMLIFSQIFTLVITAGILLVAGVITEGRPSLIHFKMITRYLSLEPRFLLLGLAGGVGLFLTNVATGMTMRAFGIVIDDGGLRIRGYSHSNIVWLAALSGFCEEVIFRGVMQQALGLWPTVLLFAGAHWGSRNCWGYCVLTGMLALCLGGLFVWSQTLWVPIIAHALNNFVAFHLHWAKQSQAA